MTTLVAPPIVPPRGTSLPELIKREHHRHRRRQLTWLILGLVVIAGSILAIVLTRPGPVPLSARFRTAVVRRADLIREVRATGAVNAVSMVSVGAEISGRVAAVEVDFNQQVSVGQVLARFDVQALEAQRAQSAALALSSRAQVAQAASDLAQAQQNKARSDALFSAKAQSDIEHEQATTALAVARARLAASQATLAAQGAVATVARTNLEHAVIRSPIDGVIITRNIDPGQTVASIMTTPVLFTIAADLRKMEVLAAIDEADIAEVEVGQAAEFTVTAWQGRSFAGRVTEVRNAARTVQDVVTYGAIVEVDNPDLALRPGMTASVRVRTGFVGAALQVPNASLLLTPPGEAKQAGPAVWTIVDGKLMPTPVHPGLTDGEQTALADGDLPADAIVLVDLSPLGKKAYGAAVAAAR